MRHWHKFEPVTAMASPWRRRRVCHLIDADGEQQTVALRGIDGRGARLDTDMPPALGSAVELRHPDAGSIRARVTEIGQGYIRIGFIATEPAIAFALNAIASDMTRD